ncbi:MAG: DUF2997 domain-containing protein [Leptolyngbyaceae cyanobacterium SL_7_1]|nr:DUF2997 domain-containing protein [Leptolyngbyaceae cyanobacterium SL_7_1]
MAEYQKIEYRIGKDGKILETVLNGVGTGCMEATAALEQALGEVESQEKLPAYYNDLEQETDTLQSIEQ